MSSDDYAAGAALMERIWGALPPSGLPPEYNARFIVEHLYGRVWTRTEIPLPLRAIVTVVATVVAARQPEALIHICGARNLGVTRQTLEEIMTHLGHYAGWPIAVMGHRLVAEVFDARAAHSEP